jgi:hypothetical protein
VTCVRSVVFSGYSGFLHHDIAKILLKGALNTINLNPTYEGKKSFEDTKDLIRSRKSKDRQHNGKKNRTKRHTTIYKTYT